VLHPVIQKQASSFQPSRLSPNANDQLSNPQSPIIQKAHAACSSAQSAVFGGVRGLCPDANHTIFAQRGPNQIGISGYGFSSFVCIFTGKQKILKMDIQALKLDLVEKILNTDKPSLLIKINNLLRQESTGDWWDKLPEEVQDSILEGIDDVKEGNVFTHNQVISEAKHKYGF
jgi:hypothetical protein